MKKVLVIAALFPALAACTAHETSVPVPAASPHAKDLKAFCYANNTAYSEGATWNGKTCRRDNSVITPGVTNNLVWH